MADDSQDGNDKDVTDSAAIGTARELLRTAGDVIGGKGKGDKWADEFDSAVESVTPPGMDPEHVDAVIQSGIEAAHREQDAIPIATQEREQGTLITVDLPPSEVDPYMDPEGETVYLRTSHGECELPAEGIVELELRSERGDTMTEMMALTEHPDRGDEGDDEGDDEADGELVESDKWADTTSDPESETEAEDNGDGEDE